MCSSNIKAREFRQGVHHHHSGHFSRLLPCRIMHSARRTRGAIQAYAGNAGNFLGRTLEWPWYVFWANAFYGSVDPRKVVAGPQSELVLQQITNDDRVVLKKKVPDFVLHYLTGVPQDHHIDSFSQVTNHEELRQFYMGKFVVSVSVVLAVCEVKPVPDPDKIRAGERFWDDAADSMQSMQIEALADARNQVQLYFSAHVGVEHVVSIAMTGPFYCWRTFVRRDVRPISLNVDGTYDPEHEDDSSSQSLEGMVQDDQLASAHVEQDDSRAPAGAGPSNERPRRGEHQVKKYSNYELAAKELFDDEEEASAEEKNTTYEKFLGTAKKLKQAISKPKKDEEGVKRQGGSKQKRKGKANESEGKAKKDKGKGKPKPKGKGEVKGKAKVKSKIGKETDANDSGDNDAPKDGDKAKETNKNDNEANAPGPSDRPFPLLELPPFLADSSESSDEGHDSDPEDDGPGDGPGNEYGWSEWYHWDTIDGVKERNRMFNAIQR
ncbi:uncharacterized protein C8Q71DRAFT_846371, partial [Rhodofomes roseus]